MQKRKITQAGFSLVELAIALMIIGLIVGGDS
ncbi:MAG: prepilin-type N-terminal cleavage/methylation domain-containing protein [Holosporales bacterium]|mgnify:FL=1|nr:prepilin-type N-terminal cleavage/methylation domain-containing protein [Holosporales bacterium]